mgnify:CR=1 FL=1
MDINKFIENFAEAIELDDAASLSPETPFRSLEQWDSLSYLSIIAMLDDEYETQIENADFRKLNTLGDVIAYIKKKKK